MTEPVELRMDAALRRVLGRGIAIRTFFDLGAAEGKWMRTRSVLMPGARFHLIEARESRKDALQALCATDPRFSFTCAAVGDHDGETYFFAPEGHVYGGWASNERVTPDMRAVPCVSLDGEMRRRGLAGPFGIKFDIHRSEMEVLAGATEVLRQTELIVFEMLFWADGGLRVPRYMTRLSELGFCLVDMADPLFRPRDGCLWQVDMLFVRAGRPEAQYRDYR